MAVMLSEGVGRRSSLPCRSIAMVVLLLAAFPDVAAAQPDALAPCERVSVNNQGGEGNASSSGPAVNANGTVVGYFSDASNLVSRDRNDVRDAFCRDRIARLTERHSVAANGNEGNARSHSEGLGPALSGDGNLFAFSTFASNLGPDDTNGVGDVYVRNRASGEQTRVTYAHTGGETDGTSIVGDISTDGRCVVYQSFATNIVPLDQNGASDVFLFDRASGLTTLVSSGPDGPGNGASITPAVSGDCRFVAFASAATNLVAGDTNGLTDIFVRDMQTGEIRRVSVASDGTQANGTSFFPDLSFDGSVVAFKSDASNLVPDDTNGEPDVFVHAGGVTTRVSVDDFGHQADGFSGPPSVSGDGRFVAFPSWAANLVSDDGNSAGDVFVYDRRALRIRRVTCGVEPNAGVPDIAPRLSTDGNWVAFASSASNLVEGDSNNSVDVFIARTGEGPCLNDDQCADGVFCNGAERCQDGTCVSDVPPCQGDSENCTCNEDLDRCERGCTIGEACYPAGSTNPANPCEICDPARDPEAWSPGNEGSPCDDGMYCTDPDTCRGGTCAGPPRSCPPDQVCVEECDMCVPRTDCGNGRVDACEQCDDGNASSGDCCSATCQREPDGSACDDGQYCTVSETCSMGACDQAQPRCPAPQVCNEEIDACCGNGIRERGEECDDGNNVAGDCCSPLCRMEPDGNPCNDGLYCTIEDSCLDGRCRTGTPRVCPGGLVCDEVNDRCPPTPAPSHTAAPSRTTTPPRVHAHNDGCSVTHANRGSGAWLLLFPPFGLVALRRWRVRAALLLVVAAVAARPAAAEEKSLYDQQRPYAGFEFGYTHPTNDHFNAVCDSGMGAAGYGGFMLGRHFGWQGQLSIDFLHPHGHDRSYKGENEWSSVLGATTGPRFVLPLSDLTDALGDDLHLYIATQGGVYTGLSGRLGTTGAGFSLGGGADYYLTDNIAVTAFGRWNRAYFSPRPKKLGPPYPGQEGPPQVEEDQGPADARWYALGLGVKYDFVRREVPAPPPAPVVKGPPPPATAARKLVFRVNFDFDKYNIRSDARPILDEAVTILKEEDAEVIIAEGHTDSIGTDQYNMRLSTRRANAVRDYLVKQGISASRITIKAYGETRPVATNDTADGRAQNRRVEIRFGSDEAMVR